MPDVEPLLLTIAAITTRQQNQSLTNATGFFFRRGERLFLVTSRHVVIDEGAGHRPESLQIVLFDDAANLASTTGFSIPLYRDSEALWKQASDSAGLIDVAVIEIDQAALPEPTVFTAFTPDTLCPSDAEVEVGTALMVVGFPLGFADTLHHLPVARQAGLASSFGLRFQGMGYFLTDARTHRGISGAPVVMRVDSGPASQPEFHWQLLGVHSARLDVGTRDLQQDEALGLNCAWYADILLTLTE
ncbi:serine protease [Mangrovimicrobium sediminis]|uniref:Serine protease n=1 Tax=Mangrovimicrobium sediminis TaxID=2562682 RepID=A0A4Z0LWM6_9GAMM|nr:serine protease [Haliea sp. SAOS-164]TGD71813.1 serine protease [Haliea sp. SAOS-164]